MKMPILFIGHGSPMNAIEENEFVQKFKEISFTTPKPKSILCISAHWETNGSLVTGMENPPTIHDFGGFPPELYEIIYPAKGNPDLALEIKNIVKKTIELDYNWGLDHGTWSVLKHFYPKADVPIIQLSLDLNKKTYEHYQLAKELAFLRNRGVLIVGSGNIIHNLRMLAWNKLNNEEYAYDWATEASDKIKDFIIQDNHESLFNYSQLGLSFKNSIPTPEHFLPLLYILALKNKEEKIIFFNDKIIAGSLSMTSMMIY